MPVAVVRFDFGDHAIGLFELCLNRLELSNVSPGKDRMKSWMRGELMAYKPNGAETPSTNALTFSGSELFKRTFEEGMSMVEETATYLDGKGRAESKLLPSKAA